MKKFISLLLACILALAATITPNSWATPNETNGFSDEGITQASNPETKKEIDDVLEISDETDWDSYDLTDVFSGEDICQESGPETEFEMVESIEETPGLKTFALSSYLFTVGSWNLRGSTDYSSIGALLNKQTPTLVGLQYVANSTLLNNIRIAAGMLDSQYLATTSNQGMGVLFNLTRVSSSSYDLPNANNWEARKLQKLVLSLSDGQLLSLYNTHLDHHVNRNLLTNQMTFIANQMVNDTNPYKVLTGCFNTGTLTDLWSIFTNKGLVTTNGTSAINIVVSPNIKIISTRSVETSLSSINPIFATLEISNVTGVAVLPTSVTLKPGETRQLSATVLPSSALNQNVTWKSSNPSVASISANGLNCLVSAVGSGTAKITVTTEEGGYTASCDVTVGNITWDADGGSVSPLISSLTAGGSFGTTPTPSRAGYIFGGWYTGKNGTGAPITKATLVPMVSTTYYAYWTPTDCVNIIWEADNGATPVSMAMIIGENINDLPPTPERSGCSFSGWYSDRFGNGERIYSDSPTPSTYAIYYAKWTVVVAFDASPVAASPERMAMTAGMPFVDLPTPERDGYFFSGWFSGAGGTGAQILPSSIVATSAVYYAKWTLIVYVSITWDADGGTATPVSQTKIAGMPMGEPPVAIRSGCTFAGWYTGKNGIGTQITATTTAPGTDTRYYAKWTATVTWNANGGSTPATWTAKTVDVALGQQMPTTTRSGYDFKGWYIGNNGTGELVTQNTVLKGNAIYYAYWAQNNSTLRIEGNNTPGTLAPGQSFSISGTINSNYIINSVRVSVYNINGVEEIYASATPNSTSYSIKTIDSSIKFGQLSSGDKIYVITVKDSSMSTAKTLVYSSFTVQQATTTGANLAAVTMGIGYINQGSSKYTKVWKVKEGSKTLKACGCNMCSVTMCVNFIRKTNYSPETLFDDAINKYKLVYNGNGSWGPTPVRNMAINYSLNPQAWKTDINQVITALRNNIPVIQNVQKWDGRYMNGHYIVLGGHKRENGVDMFLVFDPGRAANSYDAAKPKQGWYSASTIKSILKYGYLICQ
ncbi:MAG: InlB B-repeat-containing protein [Oscillospiraceae bacterium]|nr:InlB B-repeat-containing protein [Oscillospiraceae bacterium]